MTLWADFLTNRGRAIEKWTHYFPIYERHFQRFVNRPVRVLEIGCGEGGSLAMWKRYFGAYAHIVGVDIRPECAGFAEHQIDVRIGHQADRGFLAGLLTEFGTFDIVIDDGSHVMRDITETFRFLYPRIDRNGVYLVEDLHTAYMMEFGGGPRHPESFIERSKGLIDELNADLSNGAVAVSEFTQSTLSIHYYNSVVVFERGAHMPRLGLKSGPNPSSYDRVVMGSRR
jgi:SAM-dependent methyltransferase